ncbi:MAG: ABC transporter permease [Planctomycetes bacterium]|nr:ABC transporter permease [Planctomycetota bacterium]MCP4838526.1 ABC transporter permease [Planctomycetota bacterium]
MNRLLIVALREFRHTVLTKAFFIGSVVVPILIVLISIGADIFLKPNIPAMKGPLAVIDGSPALTEAIAENLALPTPSSATPAASGQRPKEMLGAAIEQATEQAEAKTRPDTTHLTIESRPSDELETIKKGIREGTWVGAIEVHAGSLESSAPNGGSAVVWLAPSAAASHVDLLTKSTRQAVVDTRLRNMDMSPEVIRAAVDRPSIETIRIGSEGGEQSESKLTRFLVPVAFMGLMWIVVMTGGNYLLMSTIEEKSTRVIEVLLSATSPTGLLAGKILGFAGVSAVMLAMYLVVAVVMMVLFAALDIVSPGDIALGIAFFGIAYLMMAAIMAGIGSAVSDVTEAQSLMGPAMLILMLPLLLIPVITEDPNGTVGVVASFIPPLSPYVMVLRIAASPEPLPLLEVLLALIWAIICAGGMIWAAGRIFRVGVLMQGKPPSPLELLRWIRYR